MALGECPECSKVISNTASSCPNCGWVSKKNAPQLNNSSYVLFGVSVASLALGIVCIFCTVMCIRWYYYIYWAIASGLFFSASFYLLLLDIALSLKQKKGR